MNDPGNLVVVSPQRPAAKAEAVAKAIQSLGDLSLPPGHTQGEYHERSSENLKKLAARLCAQGQVAFAGSEAVFVLADDGLWEEWHAVAFGDSTWTNSGKGKYIGVHKSPASPCDALQVPPLHSFVIHRRDIRGNWEKIDSTPLVQDAAYCASIGYNRNPCPAGMEGKPDRLQREQCVLRGSAPVWVWTGSGADGGLWAGNPTGFTFEHRKGSVGSLKVCDARGEKCQVVIP